MEKKKKFGVKNFGERQTSEQEKKFWIFEEEIREI